MKQPLWQRRDRGKAKGDGATPSKDSSPDDDGRESTGAPRPPSEVLARLRDLGSPSSVPLSDEGSSDGTRSDREAAYAAWADRIRTHKQDKLAGMAPDPAEDDRTKPPVSPHWDSANLFVSTIDEGPPAPALMGTRELLAVLALEEGATKVEVQSAFRGLAKEHHPDRWNDAPPEVRAEHQERMSLIVEVHTELRRRLS